MDLNNDEVYTCMLAENQNQQTNTFAQLKKYHYYYYYILFYICSAHSSVGN